MRATKQFKFELAHRLVDSYSVKCQSIHGHSYLAEVTLERKKLDSTGMVMDFGEVKNRLADFMDKWDHCFMYWDKDPLNNIYNSLKNKFPLRMINVDYNPTAENMAHHIFRYCWEKQLPVVEVRVQETKTGWAYANQLLKGVGESVSFYNV